MEAGDSDPTDGSRGRGRPKDPLRRAASGMSSELGFLFMTRGGGPAGIHPRGVAGTPPPPSGGGGVPGNHPTGDKGPSHVIIFWRGPQFEEGGCVFRHQKEKEIPCPLSTPTNERRSLEWGEFGSGWGIDTHRKEKKGYHKTMVKKERWPREVEVGQRRFV